MERRIGNNHKHRRLFAALLLAGWLIPTWVAAAPLEDIQKTVTEWARVRTESVRIEAEWNLQQTFMQSTLAALQERVQQLEAKRSELEARTSEERRDTTELLERQKAIKDAEAQAATHLRQLGERLVRMRAWLPPRLSAALELPYRSLATQDSGTGERMHYAMVILNRCVQFNRTVSAGEEILTASNGEKHLMEVVYWGLSHGYALDRGSNEAYLGAPAENGWAWTPLPDMAPQVARLLNATRDNAEPVFVIAPAQAIGPAALKPKL